MSTAPPTKNTMFSRTSWREWKRVADVLRLETVGGILLLAGAVIALVWANSPWSESYTTVSEFTFGPHALHLDLSVSHWAADGLLAIFFFVVGLELKREFVVGDLRDPRKAAIPIVAAVGGVVVPALIYVLVNLGDPSALRGWAIPTATDIAFAVAVLAVIGRFLPSALRMFLLTLAVVDDLIAIFIIAVFYTEELALVPLLLALVPLALFTFLVQRRVRAWWVLLPLALTAWALVHASGVHATVAGVLLGFAVPALLRKGEAVSLAEHFEHRFRPISAGVAVPIFALFAAGVSFGGLDGLTSALTDPVAIGIMAGLLLGKAIGIFGTTYLMGRFTRAELDSDVAWVDVFGIAVLAGIGFTVSLLVGELSFDAADERSELVKIAVLCGSLLSAAVAAVVLRLRNRTYRRIHEKETRDEDADGIPDIYQGRSAGQGDAG
ncbi:Na+/H+ antiporter NhaA [Saccharomonospora piscinae]|uniref:Na(+)/H(+) antiporter NhaA n=1 Tax=Saccharomonospora piscinae TaxID=687388 RepID=A0A1V8ZWZ5_SACPI|nr:Na+/H+ antiporter NhaA [Saccharomonospora piscinae]OQO89477.1 Na+/H+ antiporter NhaA [Saccharomonospora piscinae]TLW91167.1 Na+/H+ antiporter NhaA [Saccharomonospora piscinae]